ncbi:DUF4145 domain-containing protein [Pedobacter sp. PF22-3]|uniref:DUF4145 domain-containing protein n=1 Tax=Pedobacter sp. PF22-3 TaxID=2994467 RepID=UPI0022471A44|nr:DUF4145 domain-containing protein [Pedobacter sp. PF22-3]MCX2492800.1 DUF4145 domain-containing protein [Pedobacter sp. PF22-3]
MVSQISPSQFTSPISSNRVSIPSRVAIHCSHCVIFLSLEISWQKELNTIGNFGTALCPHCSGSMKFFYIADENTPSDMSKGLLYVYPSTRARQPLPGLDSVKSLTPQIKKSYQSTLTSFNTNQWGAAAVMSRRLLEGVIQMLQPDKQNGSFNLSKALNRLTDIVDVNKPIVTIADGIRKMGNMGAHFSEEMEPDEETSILLMDLLDYLIEFLFILPDRIEVLHDKIENLRNGRTAKTE